MSKYEELIKAVDALPKEAVEKADKNVTRKGYNTTGYQYQFLVNVLNDVIGVGEWGFNYKIIKEIEGKWNNGRGFWDITVEVFIWIQIGNKRPSFSCVGGHKSEAYADALKGAITNGFKKTVAFFGVGKKAYEGTIDDDYRPQENGSTQKETKPPTSKAPQQKTKEPQKKPDSSSLTKRFTVARARIGDTNYYAILNKNGFKSLGDIVKKADAERIIVEMETAEVNQDG